MELKVVGSCKVFLVHPSLTLHFSKLLLVNETSVPEQVVNLPDLLADLPKYVF